MAPTGNLPDKVAPRNAGSKTPPVEEVISHGQNGLRVDFFDVAGWSDAIIDALIAANPDQAASVKEKPQAIGWFVGQVMKQTGGKANPGAVNQMLKAKLGL